MRKTVVIPLLAYLGVIVLITGCAGAHFYRPADEKTARSAKDAFDASKLTTGLKAERALLAESSQREADSIRRMELALRDLYILRANQNGTRDYLDQEMLGRYVELINASRIPKDLISRKNSKLMELKVRKSDAFAELQKSLREYFIVSGGKCKTDCPSKESPCDPSVNSELCSSKSDFLVACKTYKNLEYEYGTVAESFTGGKLAIVRAQLAELRKERDEVKKTVKKKKTSYEEAHKEYEDAVKKGTESKIAATAKTLQEKLKMLGEMINATEPVSKTFPFKQHADGYLEQLKIQANATNQILEALQGAPPKDVPSGELKAAILVATPLPGLEKAFSAMKHPEVGPALLQSEFIRLELAAANKQLSRMDEWEALLQKKSDAIFLELSYLNEAMTDLNGCNSEERCPKLRKALINYAASWELARIEQRLLDHRMNGLRHETALDLSESALALREALVRIPLEKLLEYHAGGIRPESLANLIHALGLSWIAVGVN